MTRSLFDLCTRGADTPSELDDSEIRSLAHGLFDAEKRLSVLQSRQSDALHDLEAALRNARGLLKG
jgi:hypothetical protein